MNAQLGEPRLCVGCSLPLPLDPIHSKQRRDIDTDEKTKTTTNENVAIQTTNYHVKVHGE